MLLVAVLGGKPRTACCPADEGDCIESSHIVGQKDRARMNEYINNVGVHLGISQSLLLVTLGCNEGGIKAVRNLSIDMMGV